MQRGEDAVAGSQKTLFVTTLRGSRTGSPGSPTTGRAARPLSQPARVGRVGGRAGTGLSAAAGSARRGRGEGAQEATLTNLYNARPQWLADAHDALDAAVAATYGWSADISDDEVLREFRELNGGDRRIEPPATTLPGRGAGRG